METATTIDLLRYCAKKGHDPRDYLYAPWIEGDWAYATNGHLIVRVPREACPDAGPRTDRHPKGAHLFEKYIDKIAGEFVVMPPQPKPDTCGVCRGTGVVFANPCPDCKDGEFDHGDHTYECKNCEYSPAGPGYIGSDSTEGEGVTCGNCNGRGVVDKTFCSVKVLGASLDPIYAWWMSLLPQVRVRAKPDDSTVPVAFIFDGGQALVMTRRD